MCDPIHFTNGFVYRKNLVYLAAANNELEERNVYHGYILRRRDGEWGNWAVDTRIGGICCVDVGGNPVFFAMGVDGRVNVAYGNKLTWETVDPRDDGPSVLRNLNSIRQIGDYVYVAGMARQVYRRSVFQKGWGRFDKGMLVPPDRLEVAGILGIDGTGPDDIYTVGFYGEIWHFDGVHWEKLESPTNLKLECVRCIAPDLVYIAGARGMIFRGYMNRWELVEQFSTEATFWGMEHAFDSVFFSTEQGMIYQLHGDSFEAIDPGIKGSLSTRSLHFNDGLLLSVGLWNAIAFDGTSWHEMANAKIPPQS